MRSISKIPNYHLEGDFSHSLILVLAFELLLGLGLASNAQGQVSFGPASNLAVGDFPFYVADRGC